jgi:DNA-binding response OmpR family regulator
VASPPVLLVVEDEADMRTILDAVFRGEGYAVRVAKNGVDGLRLARKHKPRVIITDIMMPLMDGREMVRRLRLESAVPVLFLTAKNDEADRVSAEAGGDGYMTKPFAIDELTSRVRSMLRRTSPSP